MDILAPPQFAVLERIMDPMREKPILYLVIPSYNEEKVLPLTAGRIESLLSDMISQGKIHEKSRCLFVNDGSRDQTWPMIQALHNKNLLFLGVSLSRNRGHQNALLAGLMTALPHADCTISMDADLQDDPEAIVQMVDAYLQGKDVVYGVRKDRSKDRFFKRFTAESYYKILQKLGGEIIYNHADYRLLSKRALLSLAQFDEVNLFLRGLVPMVGFPTGQVEYVRNERAAGESKYPLKKMIHLAMDGITSLSVKPLAGLFFLGLFLSIPSLIFLVISWIRFAMKRSTGLGLILSSIWLLGGMLFMGIGLVGEYTGKIYLESKRRPRFIIQEVLMDKEGEEIVRDHSFSSSMN